MVIVVIGGSGSGKSEFAENLAVTLGSEHLVYIATMEPYGTESKKRIEKHQQMRKEKNFLTIECPVNIKSIRLEEGTTALLECMSNLAANEMFSEKGSKEEAFFTVKQGIRQLMTQTDHLIIVTNNIFEEGMEYTEETREYVKLLGKINWWLGTIADQVFEVVYGIPVKMGEKE